MLESELPVEADASGLKSLDSVVAAIRWFLQAEVRLSNAYLARKAELDCKENDLRDAGCTALPRIPEWEAMQRKTQKQVDRCERWLTLDRGDRPGGDSDFEKIAWLCGVSRDVVRGAIDDAREAEGRRQTPASRRRVVYVEEVYGMIYNCILASSSRLNR